MADFTDTRTASEGRVLAGLLALAALYVVALGWQFRDAVVDDAYIGLVFLRNLLAGQGFVFHAGSMPVEGISNIGWILALVPLAALIGPVTAAKLSGAVLLLIALVLTGKLGQELGRRLQRALPHADTLLLAPPLVLAASFEFLFFSLAGMETALLACLLLCMAACATRNAQSVLLPILGALAFTVHPEAVLVYPLFVVLRLIARPQWPDHCKTSSPSRIALILSELASSPSRAASRPPQDEDAARRRTLAPQREEVVGDLILRCEGEARASKDEVIYYAMIPYSGRGCPRTMVPWAGEGPVGLREFLPPRRFHLLLDRAEGRGAVLGDRFDPHAIACFEEWRARLAELDRLDRPAFGDAGVTDRPITV